MKSGQRVYVDVYARRRSGLRDGGRVVVRPGGGMHEWPKPVRSYADSGEPAAHRGHSLALGKLSEWVQTLVRREMLAQSTDGPMLVISGAPTH